MLPHAITVSDFIAPLDDPRKPQFFRGQAPMLSLSACIAPLMILVILGKVGFLESKREELF